jgi:hypothetical protein
MMDARLDLRRCHPCGLVAYVLSCEHGTGWGAYEPDTAPTDREGLVRGLVDADLACLWGCYERLLMPERRH